MVQLVIVLLLVGIAFLIAEIITCSFGIFGGVGLVSLIVSAVLMVIHIEHGVIFATILGVLVIVGVLAFFKLSSKRGLFRKFVMEDTLAQDASGVVDLSSFDGRAGVAATPLRPIGMVDFGGLKVEAYSNGDYIDTGCAVVVVETSDKKIVVANANKASAAGKSNPN